MDIDIFENGWDRNNTYIFGWIMSDGCLKLEGRNKTALAVRISSNDLDIMQWLHNKLCIGNKIYDQGKNGYQIKYRNKESIELMILHGLTMRKSLTMEYPCIPEDVFSDFLRGYFDGDGSIVLRQTKYNLYGQVSFTCGSKQFLDGLQAQLFTFDITSHIYEDGRKTNKSYYLRVIKRSEIEKLYHLMYDNLECKGFLSRKYEKYSQLITSPPKYKSHVA